MLKGRNGYDETCNESARFPLRNPQPEICFWICQDVALAVGYEAAAVRLANPLKRGGGQDGWFHRSLGT